MSQTLTSQYGQQPLTVDDEIPTHALRWKLGQTHVGTPPADVEALVRERAGGQNYTDSQTEQTVAAALWIHRENLGEYRWVTSGCRWPGYGEA